MNINSIYKKISICVVIILCIAVSGCNKFVEVPDPIDTIPSDLVFTTDAKADAAVRALYEGMVPGPNPFGGAIQASLGLSADELTSVSTSQFNDFFLNTVASSNTANGNIWSYLYGIIYNANQIIQNIPSSTGMTDAAKTRYMGEARFIRAAMYFYLVNCYGDVPLAITPDYTINATLARTPVSQVYDLILNDLKIAQSTLPAAYLNPTQRFRANRYSASALLARVYLFKQDYVNAEIMASDVIDGAGKTVYDVETDLTKTFLIGSKEVILQLPPIATLLYTNEGALFNATGIPNYTITDALYTSFETGDLRKTSWIKVNSVTTSGVTKTYPFPYKYKISSGTGTTKTEGLVFLRISEVYLIRAEARAQQNKLATAISDIDVIRGRSGITKIAVTKPAITQADLLTAIAHERFVELFTEMGHRWFDLKRTGLADATLKNKPNWRPEAKLLPVPAYDILYNPNLTQNPGYN